MISIKRSARVLTIVGTLTLASTSAAVATYSFATLSTTGASLSSGQAQFYNPNTQGTKFYYSGNLNDTANDGNNPFVHAKVAGYGYATRIYNTKGPGTSLAMNQTVSDPAGDGFSNANVQVCRDRGTLYPDNCVDRNFYV